MQIEIGQELPTFERVSGFHAWNRFAAVNDEFVPIHMDDDAGRRAGNPGAFGMGNLQFAYLHAVLRQWVGDDGRIIEVACQFRAPNLRGLTTIARGKVVAIRDQGNETIVDLEVWTETEEGTVMTPGSATVALPKSE
jgi:acyl dehydratase